MHLPGITAGLSSHLSLDRHQFPKIKNQKSLKIKTLKKKLFSLITDWQGSLLLFHTWVVCHLWVRVHWQGSVKLVGKRFLGMTVGVNQLAVLPQPYSLPHSDSYLCGCLDRACVSACVGGQHSISFFLVITVHVASWDVAVWNFWHPVFCCINPQLPVWTCSE